MHQRSVAAVWVNGLVDALANAGVDTQNLCRDIGLDLQKLAATNTGCPAEKLNLLWELAELRSGNRAIGLATQHTFKPASFDVVGYAMMSSASLAEGLERLVRYMRILGDAQTISLSQLGDTCAVNYELFGGDRPVARQRFESAFVNLLTFFRWMSGRDLCPLAVEFSQATPTNLAPYEAYFRCPLHFNASSNRIVFSLSDLSLPLPTASKAMAELHDRFAGQKIVQLDNGKLSPKVRELLVKKFPDGEPGREQIARLLCVSERTLQRQLNSEDTSFHQLIDQTRRELAVRYLAQAQIALAEVAYLLGFAGHSNLTRACKRWFGLSPRQYRAQLGIAHKNA